ncbi:Tat pathway signal protein [Halostella sp. PRR32]|uniref:DUF7405 family protein n=1 Tax=Halostella sp. PRR32 TaxID=3098147 RepID=UPI002B1D1180|nr:Tat pathway signal protein [Halostella sp. PRR32]
MPSPNRNRGISRREFAKSAVAIGGSAALAACMERDGNGEEEEIDVPQGPSDLSALSERQHAWNELLSTDTHGNRLAPAHNVVLMLDYSGDGTPSERERETLETALRDLERAYQRDTAGLLFTLGYSPSYFARYDASLPESIDLPEPRALSPLEDPALDEYDAVLHLASDHAQVALAAEEALFGELDELNGVETETSVDGVVEKAERRTGFVGEGLPAENQDVRGIPDSEPVPEDAPLYMGFKSGFEKNQASEERVTIQDGPFAGGTTKQLSRIRLNLQQWYEQDSRDQRVAKMFCPVHAEEDKVEGAGENLGEDTQITGDCVENVEEHARTKGMVGHSQKAARAREDDDPIILRRDFDSTNGGEAGLHFVSLQRSISDFVDTREAMNGTDLAENSAVGQRTNNGILRYMSVKRRGNFLIPPRSLRAFPSPKPE